jgi:hypothetical protein
MIAFLVCAEQDQPKLRLVRLADHPPSDHVAVADAQGVGKESNLHLLCDLRRRICHRQQRAATGAPP